MDTCFFKEILDGLNKYSNLIVAFATFSTVLVALYLGEFRERLRKPNLKICFKEGKQYPYFRTLAFDRYDVPIEFRNTTIFFHRPAFLSFVKIKNMGKWTAKKVEVRIEKIEFVDTGDKILHTRYYHPSRIKWSGENRYGTIEILPDSSFFLDLFYSVNETMHEIVQLNRKKYLYEIEESTVKDLVKEYIVPQESVYWNVWIESSFNRGVPVKYDYQGKFKMYFILNAENHKPIRFQAEIIWEKLKWNFPDIRIKVKNRCINYDPDIAT